jgi:dipeptidase
MDLTSDDFMLSSNAAAVATKIGWWDGKGAFNWAGSFGLGEYNHPYYGARRIWTAYNILAPSANIDSSKEITPEDAGYPFAVKPDHLLEASDVFKVYRDYLEGTEFSLVKDELSAGPFNSPRRVAGGDAEAKITHGGWERPISIYRNDYAVLSELRSDGHGVVWAAPHTPHASVFAPVWSSAAKAIPRPYVVDATKNVDRESLFGAVSGVSNWAHGSMFSHAIIDIRERQRQIEKGSMALASLLHTSSESHTEQIDKHASSVHAAWWDLFWDLMGKYADGYVVTRDTKGAVTSAAVGYPEWYLNAVDYEKGVNGCSAAQYDALNLRVSKAVEEFKKIDAMRRPAVSMVEDITV